MLRRLTLTTAGESHGVAIVAILEGIPAGLRLTPADVARELARRQGGHGRGGRMKIERDAGELFAGVRLGETIGAPIAIRIPNRDFKNWRAAMAVEAPAGGEDDELLRRVHLPRPGHADLTGMLKYGRSDARDVLERASARETAARVAAGAVARRLLAEFGVRVESHVVRIGPVESAPAAWPSDINAVADGSPVRCLDDDASAAMVDAIDAARRANDSLGGVFEVVARGLPVGLGSHATWETRLSGRLAGALLSIHAMKGVEIGLGFVAATRRGSEVHDEIDRDDGARLTGGYARRSNRAGGLEGGMTTGEPLVVRVAMKPLSSLRQPLDSVNVRTGESAKAIRERSDVCAVPAAAIVGEAMVALVLADAWLEKFGGDSVADVRAAVERYLDRLAAARPGPASAGDASK